MVRLPPITAKAKTRPPSEQKRRYLAYIASPEWEKRRAKYYLTHSRVCARCKSKDLIHLHHVTYVRMGNERDGDLLALCMTCHRLVHEHHRLHPSLGLARSTRELLGDGEPVTKVKAKKKTPSKKTVDRAAALRRQLRASTSPVLAHNRRKTA